MIVESLYAPKKRSAFNLCHALILLLSFIDGLYFRLNIARIANAVQVTICLLVSTSVY